MIVWVCFSWEFERLNERNHPRATIKNSPFADFSLGLLLLLNGFLLLTETEASVFPQLCTVNRLQATSVKHTNKISADVIIYLFSVKCSRRRVNSDESKTCVYIL